MPNDDVQYWLKHFTFGKYKGKTYCEVIINDPDYFKWVVKNCPKKIPKKQILKHELTEIIDPELIH